MAYIVTDWLLGIQKSAYCALIQCCHQCWLHFVLTYFVGVCSFISEISQQPDHRHFSFFVVIHFIFQRFCVSITLGQTVHETKWVWKFPAKDEKSQVFWCVCLWCKCPCYLYVEPVRYCSPLCSAVKFRVLWLSSHCCSLLGRGSMFVLSHQQFERMLGLSPVRKAENLIDLGQCDLSPVCVCVCVCVCVNLCVCVCMCVHACMHVWVWVC